MSIHAIAQRFGCSRCAIRNGLKVARIARRDSEVKAAGNPSYGRKWRKGKMVSQPDEARVVRQIRKLRGQGLSFREIAEALNALGIPTKTKSSRWHGRTVQRVLKPKSKLVPCRVAIGPSKNSL